MNDPELRHLLEQLHQEIENADSIDEKDRDLLSHVGADIRTLLDRSKEEEDQPFPFDVEELEETIRVYQASHPVLATTLARLVAILSNAGI